MAGFFLLDSVLRWRRNRKRIQKLARATNWPTAEAEINHWNVLPADKDQTAAAFQVEAGFHFKLNGEYFGGYLRSVALTHHEAETQSKGTPTVNIRYNPANPDETAVLAEDNATTLPFRVISS